MKKYYYYDNNGNKKYYMGNIIKDHNNNITYGLLTKEKTIYNDVELEYHPEIKAEQGYNSYFTYINSEGNIVKYNGLTSKIKKGINNTYFLTYIITNEVEVKKHNKINYVPGYFTYIDNLGKEQLYSDDISYIQYDKRKSTYYILK